MYLLLDATFKHSNNQVRGPDWPPQPYAIDASLFQSLLFVAENKVPHRATVIFLFYPLGNSTLPYQEHVEPALFPLPSP